MGCIGPGPVKNVFPVTVVFGVQRHGSNQVFLIANQNVAGAPSSFRSDGVASLKTSEKLPVREWVIGIGQCVPFFLGHAFETFKDVDPELFMLTGWVV